MSWWCAATREPWTWEFRAYPGIWLTIGALVLAYVVSSRRHRRTHELTADDRRKRMWFTLGIILLWLSTDWPLGALGAGYLATAHMLQYMLYTLAVAPLLLLGTPEWMIRPLVDRLRLDGFMRIVAKPVVAGVTFNVVLIATHAPWTVDTFRADQLGSMVLDIVWLLSGLVLWLPLVSPLPELRHPSPAVRCVYLFLAAGALPMIPGGILTFSEFPLYATYELAPRVWGIAANDDQQTAGIIMKIGSLPVVWTVIFVVFARWALRERDENVVPDRVTTGVGPRVSAPDHLPTSS
jgi:putative membrane protein